MKIKIKHDVYNIANRIKVIDKNYYIVLNTSTMRYEVHHSGQVGGSYCLTLPYTTLDARALDFVNKTKTNNLNNLIKEIEKNNAMLERTEEASILNRFNISMENLLKRR